MLNGDLFAKKFGEDTSATGVIDGTNGEDFFRVWIIGENMNDGSKDSIEFYLADYRFADNTEDYILDTWENIDLSAMGFIVNKVSIRFESSDIGDFGMNTPAYVAIDNINWEAPVGISEVIEADYKIYPNPVNDILRIEGPAGILSIASINGKEVIVRSHNLQSNINFSALPAGVYVLSINTPNGTVTKRIIK